MRLPVAALAALAAAACARTPYSQAPLGQEGMTQDVRIFLDAGDRPLGAYRLEVRYDADYDQMKDVVGGEEPFDATPNVDTEGLADGVFSLAWFHLSQDAPTGRVHVATVRVISPYRPELHVRVVAAADTDGEEVPATVSTEP